MKNLGLTNLEKGLSEKEAKRRLRGFGRNEFEKKKEFSAWKLLISQFKSPLIYVLGFAGLVTMYLNEWIDTGVIFLVVLSNTLLGFWQERKAARALEALKGYLKPRVKVIRNGEKVEIAMEEVVPGDVCLLDAGESVPADGVVISAEMLVVNEAILTGESRPVEKEMLSGLSQVQSMEEIKPPAPQEKAARRFVYMGTSVSSGLGLMLVVGTGHDTEMGKIAKSLTATEEEPTPLQQKLEGLARQLMVFLVAGTVLIFIVGLVKGHEVKSMFETSVAMAVAAIPEGLAVTMTVILSIGMQRILKRKALVRKLVAAETLGSVSVICSDKTGTITEGKMRVVDYVGDRDELVRGAILANDQRDEEGLAMAGWALSVLKKEGVTWGAFRRVDEVKAKYARLDSYPFSSARKFMASLNKGHGDNLVFVAGAPEVVLGRCDVDGERKKEELDKVTDQARKGYRLIGFASRKVGKNEELADKRLKGMKWAGFLVFEDPIRPHVQVSLNAAEQAGVDVKVITGDYRDTAIAVMKRLLGPGRNIENEQVLTGDELEKMTARELGQKIGRIRLFARTTPDQKLKIVGVLKKRGGVVAMTGDGVNDAPALKAADIGVVVNEATDVSKQTADMVLLDSNFRTIVAAIREGRVIYETMRKVVTYLLADAFQEFVLIGGSLVFGLPLPVTAVQILWINLVEDGLPGIALSFDLTDEGVMEERPRRRERPILDGEMKALIVTIGGVANLLLFGVYWYLLKSGMPIEEVQTMMFVGIGSNSLLYIFSVKSLRVNLWKTQLFGNWFLWFSVILGFLLMMAAVYVKSLAEILGTAMLSWQDLALVLGISLVTIVMIEVVKWVYFHSGMKEQIKVQTEKAR